MNYCSPSKSGKGAFNGTCFGKDALLRIVKAYNDKNLDNQIQVSRSSDSLLIWNQIKEKLSNICGENERCWLKQPFISNDKVVKDYYKPLKPEGKTKWLNTTNINNVLHQFEEKYPTFAFMGTVPIDFNEILLEFAKIDLCKLYNGDGDIYSNYKKKQIRQYGFVFNLDKHNQKGSHWVCMFIDFTVKEPFIGYFDSVGITPPPKEITKLMYKLSDQAKSCLGINLRLKSNSIKHQRKSTECGMYCIYFIHSCLESGKTFEEITRNVISDDEVNKLRDFYFRPD